MASSLSLKNRYTFTISLFLLLFILSIFFFTKRALEPSLSVYRDLGFKTPYLASFLPTTPHTPNTDLGYNNSITIADFPDYPEIVGSSIPKPISPFPEIDSNTPSTPNTDLNSSNSITIANLTDDPEIIGSSTPKPISPIPEIDSVIVSKNPQFVDFEVNLGNNASVSENKSVGSVVNFGSENEEISIGETENSLQEKVNGLKKCDLYSGTWVKDDGYPIYEPGSCPYVDEAFSCQANGRRDSEYLKWRWKPDGCDLPRFNASDFLKRLKGKRLMLVGDSMNRNQFESILCVLREGLPDKSRMYETHGYRITKGRGYYIFKFVDYNCTVEFVRSHFLVKEGIRLNAQRQSNPTLSIDRIDKSARRWMRADILVFNTGHWWTHGKTARGKNYYKEGDFIYPQFDAIEAYRRAIRTWGRWIDKNVDPATKMVFYRGYSNAHFRGGDWDSGGTCNGETEPILSGPFLDNYPLKMKIVEDIIREMKVPVILLNVTRLTNFRKDGHPSIYGKNRTVGRKISARRQDCSHWCLPGVPDAWNELIYANLVVQQTTSSNPD